MADNKKPLRDYTVGEVQEICRKARWCAKCPLAVKDGKHPCPFMAYEYDPTLPNEWRADNG